MGEGDHGSVTLSRSKDGFGGKGSSGFKSLYTSYPYNDCPLLESGSRDLRGVFSCGHFRGIGRGAEEYDRFPS